jgi:hypothetical protein
MLFDKIRKTPQPEPQEVDKLFSRLQDMRDRVGHRDVPVSDLFGLVGHDETKVRWPQVQQEQQRKEPVRVRPEDVPVANHYIAWE